MAPLTRLNSLSRTTRWFTKSFIFILVAIVVCFPRVDRLVIHLHRVLDLNALVSPNAPEIQPWVAELSARLGPDADAGRIVQAVERFVYDNVQYAWDWDNWGNADFVPTVAEVVARKKEDCDGRAVVAASLMTKLGIPAHLSINFAHVWVSTDSGEAMAPGKRRLMEATDRGLQFNWRALPDFFRAAPYGIAVFPWYRELIIFGTLWLLLIRPPCGAKNVLIPMAPFLVGFVLLRHGGSDYSQPVIWAQWTGAALMFFGIFLFCRSMRTDAHDSNPRSNRRGGPALDPEVALRAHGPNGFNVEDHVTDRQTL